MFYGGLTYSSHPLACAAALAHQTFRCARKAIDLIARAREMGGVMKALLAGLQRRHPSVGEVRSIGLFGIVELIRDRTTREPNGAVQRIVGGDGRARAVFQARGTLHAGPLEFVLYESAAVHHRGSSLREAFAIIDRGLEITDRAVRP